MNDADTKARMFAQGYRIATGGAAEATAIMRKDSATYKSAIDEYGIRAD